MRQPRVMIVQGPTPGDSSAARMTVQPVNGIRRANTSYLGAAWSDDRLPRIFEAIAFRFVREGHGGFRSDFWGMVWCLGWRGVQDVVDLLYFEDLVDVILVGWSYGGAVADGVADLVPERLRDVVNLDGEILREGHSLLDGWTEEAREHYGPTLETARRTGWMPAPTEFVSIRDPELTQWVLQRVRPHPLRDVYGGVSRSGLASPRGSPHVPAVRDARR